MVNRNRKEREKYSELKYGYYHLSTDGWKEGFLFHNMSQYAFGMTVTGLLTLAFGIKIYAFTLMPNHVHIILSGTGADCLRAFDYLKLKVSERLVKDGYQPIPDDYWFKLVLIDSPNQMRNNIIYIDRNPFEQETSIPGGYPWGSSYLQYSFVYKMISGQRAESLSKRELERITGTRKPLPPDWQFHREYGLLPSSFVDTTLYKKVFKGPKDYQSRLVKDYEAFVTVANSLEESMSLSKEELDEVVKQLLFANYSGRKLSQLSNDEKARLAVTLMKQYSLSDQDIATAMNISEHVIRQLLNAKDYGKRRL